MKAKIKEIDALRGIAAVLVSFIFHQHYLTGQSRSGPLDGLPIFSWLHHNGWVMVDLFFVISGFIFAFVYLAGEKIEAGGRAFARARFARLYPLHLATLCLAAVILALGTPASVGYARSDPWHFLLNLLMLQESGLQTALSFNTPSWSISVEIYCYCVFYLLASRARRYLYPIATTICVASVFATYADSGTGDHIARGFGGFFAGVIAQRFAGTSLKNILIWGLLGYCLLAAKSMGLSMGVLLGVGIFPAIVLAAPRIGIFGQRVFVWLGDRSYSIYLLHVPIYMGINVLIFGGEKIPDAVVWPAILGAWVAILIASDLSFRKFESPLRRWLTRPRHAACVDLRSLGRTA